MKWIERILSTARNRTEMKKTIWFFYYGLADELNGVFVFRKFTIYNEVAAAAAAVDVSYAGSSAAMYWLARCSRQYVLIGVVSSYCWRLAALSSLVVS